ncbi:hypothetical protein [Lysobacter enzymogenes]|uniref:hypothetical protein n=1 Tax=Lysobacter enzymogenes TaxID=69 RepID=UPI000895BB4C|nr:hypothetical protein [Lysobacter enzymogenes]SDX52050.1 hypothetical protein SAMN05421681_1063 [Lysobacter enzymogenes]
MATQTFEATPEQLAVLIEFCRREVHRGEYVTPQLQAVVEAISGPCFRMEEQDWGTFPVAINSDGSEA